MWLRVAKSGFMWLKVVVCGAKWLNMSTIGLFGPIPPPPPLPSPHLTSPHTSAHPCPQNKIHERFMI